MAFCSIVGVLILFNICTQLPGVLLRAAKFRTYNAAFWETIAVDLIMASIAAALVAAAFRLRHHLRALDAKIENPENSK
jgi:hypothetical protein